MADSTLVTQEEMALRRRARRRLVGAVAIALTAVVVLPMVFDPEPKPLGPEVDLNIPAKDSPFDPAPSAPPAIAQPQAGEPSPQTAEPTQPVAPKNPQAQPTAVTAETPVARLADPTPAVDHKAEAPPVRETAKPVKGEPKVEKKAEAAAKPLAQKAETKPEAKPQPKADPVFASKGYYLQLGAFGSEVNAKQLQAKVQAAGFKAGLTGTNGQFRVRVGPIPEHEKALEMQARLKSKGFSPVLLGP